jgi:hypothetical protein
VSIAPPAGTSSVWRLVGEASLGPLDILAHVSTPGSLATWHTRVLPPLDLSVKSTAIGGGAASKAVVTVKVTDAGDPVAGVLVAVAGLSKRTNSRGTAKFTVQQRGTYKATASRPGYRTDQAKVKIRQKRRR